jgi:phosphohistidine phosphatase
MRLYLMRHGPAEDHALTGRDFDRALTAAGREIVARAARALSEARRAVTAGPWRVLASPFRRAHETAEIVAAMTPGAAPVELDDDLSADAPLPLDLVRRLAADGADALLVGHQPTVEELARELVHPARVPLQGGFRTAVILTFELVARDRWHLAALLDPHRPDL